MIYGPFIWYVLNSQFTIISYCFSHFSLMDHLLKSLDYQTFHCL
jgi:hypothetical protein